MACSVNSESNSFTIWAKVSALNGGIVMRCVSEDVLKLNYANVWHKIVIEDAIVKFSISGRFGFKKIQQFTHTHTLTCTQRIATPSRGGTIWKKEKQVATKWIWLLMMCYDEIIAAIPNRDGSCRSLDAQCFECVVHTARCTQLSKIYAQYTEFYLPCDFSLPWNCPLFGDCFHSTWMFFFKFFFSSFIFIYMYVFIFCVSYFNWIIYLESRKQ